MTKLLAPLLLLSLAACADGGSAPDGADLPLGDQLPDDTKADGDWGAALQCKPIPDLPPLVSPKITVSIDGLTLHLTDAASGYDRVFPVGAGKIDLDPLSPTFRESLTYGAIVNAGRQDFQITPTTIDPCKIWWTDPATGEKSPVFAGLPFLSWYGNYGIHGPIDNFRAASGGNLRRGYVSHGCFRMAAADIVEVYARIRGVAKVPVHVQREPERRADRSRVDLTPAWIGAECKADADCGFAKGFCAKNPLDERGFCSARCTSTCADKAGAPSTFCVADPIAAAEGKDLGMCVPKAVEQDFECRPYTAMAPVTLARFHQPTVQAQVCMPGSRGWVGDHCAADADCRDGTTCRGATALRPGVCSMSCDKFCTDAPGYADTFCGAVPALGAGGSCVRQCTPGSNASECPTDMVCGPAPRNGQPGVTKNVCLPR